MQEDCGGANAAAVELMIASGGGSEPAGQQVGGDGVVLSPAEAGLLDSCCVWSTGLRLHTAD